MSAAPGPIAPHGGTLVDRLDPDLDEGGGRPRVTLSPRQQADLDLIAVGAMSPLEGFMDRAAYESVLTDMRLPSGLAWSVPVTLAVQPAELEQVGSASEVELVDASGRFLGVMEVTDRFETDQRREARLVYGTEEDAHPGVASLYAHGTTCLAGPVRVAARMPLDPGAAPYLLDPRESRAAFDGLGWSTVVGFQTRNPIHRAHEYITKVALETVDGLFLHPLVGETKSDDIPADVRMRCYEALIEHYYPKERVVLGVLPAAMRYAGPREAVLHAIMRQNYGCTHFIVGRDHAGVGSYYGTYDAHRIFDDVTREELAIQPEFFEHAFWCNLTGGMATTKTSPSAPEQRVFLSGTKVREMLGRGEIPPVEFTRPEVAQILIQAYQTA
ncbi:sulfate adenylyltransferase [Miltoncostaea marina]|uniref:sulfate adenylyltransferase n=1 Tax=Miltoncostaea marina TaxID=2843215 RepID=UPI001C3D2481|nr:sulfate adenylyltransferase [Miltoncostaea marina]